MENRRIVILTLALLAVATCCAPAALAYDNVGAHRAINTAAILYFIKDMPLDDYLRNAELDVYNASYGYSWDLVDGKDDSYTYIYTQKVSVYRQNDMGVWIVGGGYSADEPEMPMGARHFYDPLNATHFLSDPVVNIWPNPPRVDSLSWALDPTENLYSFFYAKKYFKDALTNEKPEISGFYGKAWRSVGETMHIISDLTVPAHVRNDAHPWIEPLEIATNVSTVLEYYSYPAAPLDYDSVRTNGLRDLMKDVAFWTNANFFSLDTVPPFTGYTNNHQPIYGLPQPLGPYDDGYYRSEYEDGTLIKAFRMSASGSAVDIGGDVIPEQQSRLIPTAVRASEAVLDAFLPRFTVTVDSVKVDTAGRGYVVNAHVEQKATAEWPANSFPKIMNGAKIRVLHASGTVNEYYVPLTANSPATSLNSISTVVPAQPGDQVIVYYNFGGYKVFSGAYTITGTSPTAAPTAKPTASPSYPQEYDGTWVYAEKTVFVYSGGATETIGLDVPADPLRPGQSFTLSVHQSCSGGSPRLMPEDDAQRMYELSGKRSATLTINTGGMATQDYSQNVEAGDDYVAIYVPFTVRSNAPPGSYTVTVTVADEYGKTRSASFQLVVAQGPAR
jgi:hypothetical protein